MSAINIHLNQRNFAVAALLVLMSNLIIGGILLPYQQAQAAFTDWIGGPSNILNFILQGLKWVWEKAAVAYQTAGVWVTAAIKWWEKADTWYQRALKAAWEYLKKKMLDMLVDDIIKWIQGGGKPKVVTDWQGFLRDAADKAGGQFVDQYLGMGFLCDRFDAKLKVALATVPTFDQAVRCPLSMMKANVDRFLQNFSNGGWKSWIQISTPQNNIYGAYLMALDKKIGVESAAAEAKKNEAVASAGFLGDKRCVESYLVDPDDGSTISEPETLNPPLKQEELAANEKCTKWDTITPGKIAAEATVQAVNLDINWLLSSDQFGAYLGAIIDAVINRAIKEGITYATTPSGGSAGQTGPGISTGATAANANINLLPYQDAIQNNDVAPALTQQLGLLSDNYNGYLRQLQNNLTVLTQISNTQNSIADTLQQIINLGCSLPAGVTQTNLGAQTIGNCATTCPCAAKTTQTTRFTISGVGEITRQQTTAITQAEDDFSGNACQPLSLPSPQSSPCSNPITCSSNTTSAITNSTTTSSSEITSVNNEIANAQSKISPISAAIDDIQNYQQTATLYINLYEAVQRGTSTSTQQELNSAEEAIYVAKDRAVASTQAVTGSSSSDFQTLLQEIQNVSLQVIQKNSDAQTKRGGITNCDYVQPGTYYSDLCSAQRILTNMKSALTACQIATPGP